MDQTQTVRVSQALQGVVEHPEGLFAGDRPRPGQHGLQRRSVDELGDDGRDFPIVDEVHDPLAARADSQIHRRRRPRSDDPPSAG